VLRFFALREKWESYKKPMKDFISDFMRENKDISEGGQQNLAQIFKETTESIATQIGPRAFRLKSGLNVALLDSLMVAVAEIGPSKIVDLKSRYTKLLANEAYREAISDSTTDVERVQSRIKI